jgi:hypothetical protein
MPVQSIKRLAVVLALSILVSSSATHAALKGYWAFDEGSGTTTADSTATYSDANFTNLTAGAWSSDTHAGGDPYSIEFGNATNGLNGYVNLGNLGLTGPATVSLWVKADALSDNDRLYSQADGTPNASGAINVSQGSDNGPVRVWDGGNWQTIAPANSISVNAWHHLAFVYGSDTTLTIYIDGVAQTPFGTGVAFDFSAASMGIGARFVDTYGQTFNGLIDDVSIWNEALSSTKISQLAAGASPLTVAPEPASLALVAAGGLLLIRRRASRAS